VPLTVRATFNDRGAADTHTAKINWGDGTIESVQVTETPVPPGSAGTPSGTDGTLERGHTFYASGVQTVTLEVGDDDGGTGVVSTPVAVRDPRSAVQSTAGMLQNLIADPAIPQPARERLTRALRHLDGPDGVMAKLSTGDLAAAVRKLQLASEDLDAAIAAGARADQVRAIQRELAGIARSIAATTLQSRRPALSASLLDLLDTTFARAVAQLASGLFTTSIANFHEVTRRAVAGR
jgi:hypothetical protein